MVLVYANFQSLLVVPMRHRGKLTSCHNLLSPLWLCHSMAARHHDCCITLWVCKSNCSILTNAKFKLILCIYVYVYIYLYHFTKYDFAICHFGIPYSVSTPLVLCYLRYFDTWHWCYCLWHTVFQPCWCFFYTWHWHWCCLWHTVFQPSWCYFDIWHRCCLWHNSSLISAVHR